MRFYATDTSEFVVAITSDTVVRLARRVRSRQNNGHSSDDRLCDDSHNNKVACMLTECLLLADSESVANWTLLATVVVAIATVVYVVLTHQLLRAQTDPCVIVYTKFDGGSHILLVIENVGHGVAKDVRFELSREIPKYAIGADIDSGRIVEMMKSGPLVDGIPAMKPGESRVTVWGQIGGLKKALADGPVKVTCRFKKLRGQVGVLCDEDLDPVECLLEVDSFAEILSIGDSTTSRLNALESRIMRLENKILK
jgi:hypothetical protein